MPVLWKLSKKLGLDKTELKKKFFLKYFKKRD